MQENDITQLAAWLMNEGLKGAAEADLLAGFCEACRDGGLDIGRSMALMDTLHPVYEGRAFRWDSQEDIEAVFEYGPSGQGIGAENWRRSAFYHLQSTNETEVRRRIGFGDPLDFYSLDLLKEAGHTDFIAFANHFGSAGTIGEMDCCFVNFVTAAPDGFGDSDVAVLRRLVPALALAIKCTALGRIARTIAEVYLGEDAARQVLEGKITRGKAERISAALWFSDLAHYTRISDTAEPDEIIPMLNDYADAVISSIHEAGGNVLKLIGDGTLAIFKGGNSADACAAALRAEATLRKRAAGLERAARDRRASCHGSLSRPAHRRRFLRQYRKPGPARLHGDRPRGQRGKPYRLAVSLGRSQHPDVVGFRQRRAEARARRPCFGRPLCAARRQPRAGAFYAHGKKMRR